MTIGALPQGNGMNKPYDTLWTNVHLATMAEAEGYGIIPNGALGIRDGRIAYVGTAAALGGEPASMARNVEDAGGRWMMPGLIDCHTHLVYAGNRAHEFAMRLNGKSYAEIAEAGGGIVSTVTATREADEERLYAQSARRLEAMLAHGVTTVEIKSGYGLDLTAERKMLRVARRLGEAYPVQVVTTFLGAHALPPEYAGNADEYITYVVEEMLPALHVEGLVDRVDAFCERIGFSAAQVERVFAAASVLKLPVTLHAEQLSDQQGAQLAAKYRALSADHLEYVSEDGIRAMAEAGTVAVLLPGAFYFLKETRIPPVDMLRRYGVPIVLATDCNPGSSPTTNLLLMLNMGCVFFGLTPLEAVQGVTCHAARALGLTTETGTLEVGKVADIALWDISHPEELAYGMGNSLSATSLFHAQC